MRIVSLMTILVINGFGCNNQVSKKLEKPDWKVMTQAVIITQDQENDSFVVRAIESIGETGIKSVIVERESDGYLVSALSARDIEIGSKIKLIMACRQLNSGKKRSSTLMIE